MEKKQQKLNLKKSVIIQLATEGEQLNEKEMKQIAGGKRYPGTRSFSKENCNT